LHSDEEDEGLEMPEEVCGESSDVEAVLAEEEERRWRQGLLQTEVCVCVRACVVRVCAHVCVRVPLAPGPAPDYGARTCACHWCQRLHRTEACRYVVFACVCARCLLQTGVAMCIYIYWCECVCVCTLFVRGLARLRQVLLQTEVATYIYTCEFMCACAFMYIIRERTCICAT